MAKALHRHSVQVGCLPWAELRLTAYCALRTAHCLVTTHFFSSAAVMCTSRQAASAHYSHHSHYTHYGLLYTTRQVVLTVSHSPPPSAGGPAA